MTTDDLEAEIEKTRRELEGKQERLEELKKQRADREAEEVDLEAFEEMTARERRELKSEHPDRWRELMQQKRQRAERRLEETPGGEVI